MDPPLQTSVLDPSQYLYKEFLEYNIETLFEPSKIYDFIEVLYDKLIENKICFLSGSFVFEDPELKLFYTLCGLDKSARTKLNLTRAGPFTATHSVFLLNDYFKSLRSISSNCYLDDEFNKKINTINILGKELQLQYQRNIIKPFEYLCDKCCKDPHKDIHLCSDIYCNNNKEIKGAILFYPFRVIQDLDNGNKRIKTYLFFKLEGYEALSLKHSIAAIKRYVLKKEKKLSHPVRREDQKYKKHKNKRGILSFFFTRKKKPLELLEKPNIHLPLQKKNTSTRKHKTRRRNNKLHLLNEELNNKNTNKYIPYTDELKEKDLQFIKTILKDNTQIEEAKRNFKYYNENIRSSRELFIPKEITLELIKKFNDMKLDTNNHKPIITFNLDETLNLTKDEELDEIPYVLYVQKVLSLTNDFQLSTTLPQLSRGLGLPNLNRPLSTPPSSPIPIGTGPVSPISSRQQYPVTSTPKRFSLKLPNINV